MASFAGLLPAPVTLASCWITFSYSQFTAHDLTLPLEPTSQSPVSTNCSFHSCLSAFYQYVTRGRRILTHPGRREERRSALSLSARELKRLFFHIAQRQSRPLLRGVLVPCDFQYATRSPFRQVAHHRESRSVWAARAAAAARLHGVQAGVALEGALLNAAAAVGPLRARLRESRGCCAAGAVGSCARA
eukprot:2736319-Pleurochrysis_carterae.AAC.2